MFVCWQWFEFTCRALSDLGRLATHNGAIIDLIVKQSICGLKMAMVEPTNGMIRGDLRLRALDVRSLQYSNGIKLGCMTGLESLSLSSFYLHQISIDDVLTIDTLKRLKINDVKGSNVAIHADFAKLRSLVDLDVSASLTSDTEQSINSMTWLERLARREAYIDLSNSVRAYPEANICGLKLPSHILSVDEMTALSKLTRMSVLSIAESGTVRDVVSMPPSLVKLKAMGDVNLDLSRCSSLVDLTIYGCRLYAVSMLRSLRGLSTLKRLIIMGCGWSNDMDEVVSGMNSLTKLDVHSISDSSLLSGLTNLRTLKVYPQEATNVGWALSMTNIQSLGLSVSSRSLGSIDMISNMTNIRRLRIISLSPRDTDDDLALTSLSRLVGLQTLKIIGWIDVRDKALEFLTALRELKVLKLDTELIGSEGLRCIANVTTLESLDISKARYVRPHDLRKLKSIPRLERLVLCPSMLSYCRMDDYCQKCNRFIK
jgi:hypothetical protein